MVTVKEKIDQLCLEYGVRSTYPEKFKEGIRVLVIEECRKLTKNRMDKVPVCARCFEPAITMDYRNNGEGWSKVLNCGTCYMLTDEEYYNEK